MLIHATMTTSLRMIAAIAAASFASLIVLACFQVSVLQTSIDELRRRADDIGRAVSASRALGTGFLLPDAEIQIPRESVDILGRLVPVLPFDPSTPASRAAPILRRMVAGSDIRASLYDRRGELIVDTLAGQSLQLNAGSRAREHRSFDVLHNRLATVWATVLCRILEHVARDLTCIGGQAPRDSQQLRILLAEGKSVSAIAVTANWYVAYVASRIQHRHSFEGVVLLSSPADD